jgi:hypothetical protein
MNIISSGQDYYNPTDSLVKVSSDSCSKLLKRSVKKIEKVTEHLKKANDKYLTLFVQAENKLIGSLCGVNELAAERLNHDATSSFNRFLNQNERSSVANTSGVRLPYDTLSNYYDRIVGSDDIGRGAICDCSELHAWREANVKFQAELRRTHILKAYLKDRNEFLSNAIKDKSLSGQLNSLDQVQYYHNALLNEWGSIFNDSNRLEQEIFHRIGFASIPSSVNAESQAPSGLKKLNIDELMKDASPDSKSFLAKLMNDGKNKGNEMSGRMEESKKALDAIRMNEDSVENKVQALDRVSNKLDKDSIDRKRERETWKPNPLKAKRFIDRLQWNTNLETKRGAYNLPNAILFTLGCGYQCTPRISTGLAFMGGGNLPKWATKNESGASAALATASNVLSSRLYVEYKVKGAIYALGNAELHSKTASFITLDQYNGSYLRSNINVAVGGKFKYSAGKHAKSTIEILYNPFLNDSSQSAFSFRFGYEITGKHSLKN